MQVYVYIYIYIYVSVCRLLVCNSVLSRHCSCTILLFVPVIGSSILLRLGGGATWSRNAFGFVTSG